MVKAHRSCRDPEETYSFSNSNILVQVRAHRRRFLPLPRFIEPIRAACAAPQIWDHPGVNVAGTRWRTQLTSRAHHSTRLLKAVPVPVRAPPNMPTWTAATAHSFAAGAGEEGITSPWLCCRQQARVKGGVLPVRERIKYPHIIWGPGCDRDGQPFSVQAGGIALGGALPPTPVVILVIFQETVPCSLSTVSVFPGRTPCAPSAPPAVLAAKHRQTSAREGGPPGVSTRVIRFPRFWRRTAVQRTRC